jgi:S-adenosylmethionine decarboxylase
MTQVLESAHAVGAFTGQHIIAEVQGVTAKRLNDELFLRNVMVSALAEAGATILDITSKRFDPQGVTVLVLLSESHASLHTYPEVGSAFMDVFTCGHRADPERAARLIAEALKAPVVQLKAIRRGVQ